MKVSIGKMCRGNGFSYVVAEVRKSSFQHSVRVGSFSEKGVCLPIEMYGYPGFPKGGLTEKIVLVIPVFLTSRIKLQFHELEADGKEVACATKSILRSEIKWRSRLNYRLHNAEMHRIRDIEKRLHDNQISIRRFLSSELNDVITIKGFVNMPLDEPEASLLLLDSEGREVAEPSIFMGVSRPTITDGQPRLEMGFTLRFKRGFTGCVVAKSRVGNKAGMLPLDEVSINDALSDCDARLFYRIARHDEYSLLRRAYERGAAAGCLPCEKDSSGVCFSVIVPLYKTPPTFFREMYESVLNQTYTNWELVLINASPEDERLSESLEEAKDSRVRILTLEKNLGIAGNTNVGINAAMGDYVALFDHDDLLESTALAEYAKVISDKPDTDALYCDEDLLNENGEFICPHFKSDFNIDLLRCHNYITHFLVVRTEIAKRLLLQEKYDGAQDYDFVLRIAEESSRIEHVAQVLYHWRMHSNSTASNPESKSYANEAGRKALEDHLDRCGLPAKVTFSANPFVYRAKYELKAKPLVSIIIPNKDNADVLKRCIESLSKKTTYDNYEVIIVENNSSSTEIFEYYEEIQADPRVSVITWEQAFNYSAINNYAETFAKGEYLVFLNNDIEVIEPEWLTVMLSYCQRNDVGIVGAKLLYADDTVQHAGVFMKRCDSADDSAGPNHIFMHLDKNDEGYMNRASRPQDLSAVTAACMMTKRSLFRALGGFDEAFVVAYNDVDYCLRVREEGLLVVYAPDALLYHYESLSRGPDDEGSGLQNYSRFLSEQGMMRTRWSKYYAEGDPYHGKYATLQIDR